jgi:hypothetical protein
MDGSISIDGYAFAAAVALIGAEAIVRHFDWQMACLIAGSESLLLAVLSVRVEHFAQQPLKAPCQPVSEDCSRDARRLSLRYSGAYAAYVGGYLALAGLLPFQLERWGWPRDAASLSLAITTLVFLAGAGIWNAITDARGGMGIFSLCCWAMSGRERCAAQQASATLRPHHMSAALWSPSFSLI